jgi:hypothetical protein
MNSAAGVAVNVGYEAVSLLLSQGAVVERVR